MTATITGDDLRAAVAAGHLTEAQAARVITQAEARAGFRQIQAGEDEPFELFRGFAEIFLSVGLVLFLSGGLSLAYLLGGVLTPALAAVLCWAMALYFTRRRRMSLPSIVLVTGYALGVAAAAGFVIFGATGAEMDQDRLLIVLWALIVLAALALWYRAFKLPFTMFLAGLTALGLILVVTDSISSFEATPGRYADLLDLRTGSGLALGTLLFGIVALAGGLAFDMRDPHRLGRWSASGFWLHILAAPALVNTVALTVYNIGGVAGNIALALAVAVFSALALVIDRRSFLTAGILYLGILIAAALRTTDEGVSLSLLLLILGGFLTAIGTWWTDLRRWIMRRLPDFPGKANLPPYAEVP